jgi:hypothetical protein
MPDSTPSPATCPACGSLGRIVLETRRQSDRIRRRCACGDCASPPRWTTYEITAEHLERLESGRAPLTAAAVQTARLIRMLDLFRDRLVASLPDARE